MDRPPPALDLLPGTVDTVILRALAGQPMHGYAVARFVRERTTGALVIDGAALYQALHRLERKKWVRASWGVSEHNRKAKFYELTPKGREQLQAQTEALRTYIAALQLMLGPS
jgi:transcriptional regulator